MGWLVIVIIIFIVTFIIAFSISSDGVISTLMSLLSLSISVVVLYVIGYTVAINNGDITTETIEVRSVNNSYVKSNTTYQVVSTVSSNGSMGTTAIPVSTSDSYIKYMDIDGNIKEIKADKSYIITDTDVENSYVDIAVLTYDPKGIYGLIFGSYEEARSYTFYVPEK